MNSTTDPNGNVTTYTYDAWGYMVDTECSQINLTENIRVADLNPIRYRGYYYDTEAGIYYLNSRYYLPDFGRFINGDSVVSGTGESVQGYNLFAYCFNNPVNLSDGNGNWPKWVTKIVNIIKSISTKSRMKSAIYSTINSNLPITGEPNSTQTLPNPDGTPKQKRWYGPDGKAERDRDYNHGGNEEFPHDHIWSNGKRGNEHVPPDPSYEFAIEPLIGIGIIVVCGISVAYIVANDTTGIGVVDDFLLGPLGIGIEKGLIMLTG